MTEDDPAPDDENDPEDFQPAAQPTVDASTPAGRRSQVSRAKRNHEEVGEFWKRVFSDPVGRREMWGILNGDLHTFEARFNQTPSGVPDQYANWHTLGQRDAGLALYRRWLAIAPDGVMTMHLEHDPVMPKPKAKDQNG